MAQGPTIPIVLPTELQQRYERSGQALISRNVEWLTEIGDKRNVSAFVPLLRIARWNEEVEFSIQFRDFAPTEAAVLSSVGNRVRLAKSRYQIEMYDLGFGEGGGFEYEIILPVPPPANVM